MAHRGADSPWSSSELDSGAVALRLRSVRAGVWLSFACCAAALAYALLYAPAEERLSLAAVSAAGVVGTGVVAVLPWKRIVRSPRGEWVFLAWSAGVVALIAVGAAVHQGAQSPLTLFLYLPLVYAALSYPERSVAGVAVMAGFAYALLVVGSSPDPGYVLVFAASLALTGLISAWHARSHERQRREVARLSRTDPLTGCLNRRGFEEQVTAAMHITSRSGRSFTLVLLDLDGFKRVNDYYGHPAGDELLRWVVGRLAATLRPSDSIARLGGDEFVALLPDSDRDQAELVAGRIRRELRERAPCCTGVAMFPDDGAGVDGLLHRADRDMYGMKCRDSFLDALGRRPG